MKDLKIYFSEDNEIAEMESVECHGYRLDVIVTIDGKIHHPQFITSLGTKLDSEIPDDYYKNYMEKFSVVIVKEVDKETIIKTILELSKTSYFSYCTPYNEKMHSGSMLQDGQEKEHHGYII